VKKSNIDIIIDMMGWFPDSVNGVDEKFNKSVKHLRTIQKLAQKHHDERYDTDWDSMQSILEKIWKITKDK